MPTVEIECPEVQVRNHELCVRMPGGVRVCASLPGIDAPPLALAQQLMAQTTAAMAPLSPIFDIIGAVIAIKDAIVAVPGILTDPTALFEAIDELVEKVSNLAALVPQLSVPAMVLDLIGVVATYLDGVAETLEVLAAFEDRIQRAVEIAESENLDALRQAAACGSDTLAAQLANLQASSGPVDSMIELLNTFGALVPGMPPIPTLGDLGDDIGAAAEQVRAIADALELVRAAIPL